MSSHSLAKSSTDELTRRPAPLVDPVLEAVHRDLAEHRRDGAVERLGQEREPGGGVGRVGEQPLEHDRLAEDRRGLGQGQRGRELEQALVAGEVGVDAVPQLVGHDQHVVRAGTCN